MAGIGNWGVAAGENLRMGYGARTGAGGALGAALDGYERGTKLRDEMEERERKRKLKEAAEQAGASVTRQVGQEEALGALGQAWKGASIETDDGPMIPGPQVEALNQARATMQVMPQKAGYTLDGQGPLYADRDQAYLQRYSENLQRGGFANEAVDARAKAQGLKKGALEIGGLERTERTQASIEALQNKAQEMMGKLRSAKSFEELQQIGQNAGGNFGNVVWNEKGQVGFAGVDGKVITHDVDGKKAAWFDPKDPAVFEKAKQAAASHAMEAFATEFNALTGKFNEERAYGLQKETLGVQRHQADSSRISAEAAARNAQTAYLQSRGLAAIGDPFYDETTKTWKQPVTDKLGNVKSIPASDPRLVKGKGDGASSPYRFEQQIGPDGVSTGLHAVFDQATGKAMKFNRHAELGINVPEGMTAPAVVQHAKQAQQAGVQLGSREYKDKYDEVRTMFTYTNPRTKEEFATLEEAVASLKSGALPPPTKDKTAKAAPTGVPFTERIMQQPDTPIGERPNIMNIPGNVLRVLQAHPTYGQNPQDDYGF